MPSPLCRCHATSFLLLHFSFAAAKMLTPPHQVPHRRHARLIHCRDDAAILMCALMPSPGATDARHAALARVVCPFCHARLGSSLLNMPHHHQPTPAAPAAIMRQYATISHHSATRHTSRRRSPRRRAFVGLPRRCRIAPLPASFMLSFHAPWLCHRTRGAFLPHGAI